MFGKLLKKNDPANNIGIESSNTSKSGGLEKATYITLSGHPDAPSIRIEKKITIGSEVGDLVIEDPEISPRHCSFFFNKGILSIMDHSSSQGTFINKKQLDPGKIFILNNKDKIKIGKFAAKIEILDVPTSATKIIVKDELSEDHFEDSTATHTTMPLPEENEPTLVEETPDLPEVPEMQVPELPTYSDEDLSMPYSSEADEPANDETFVNIEAEEEELDMGVLPTAIREKHEEANKKRELKLLKESDPEDIAGYEVTSKGIQLKKSESGDLILDADAEGNIGIHDSKRKNLKASGGRKRKGAKGKSKGKKVKISRDPSASFLTRLFSFINDGIICFIILEIFSVYTDFKTMYSSMHKDLWSMIKPHYNEFILPLYNDLVKDISGVQDIVKSIAEYEQLDSILSFVLFLFLVRVIAGMILSVSLGQLLIGIKVEGKFLWKRLVYPMRGIIGIITLPFLIFDLPALIGKRTFKEVITGTQYITRSKKLSFVSALTVTPLLLLGLCFSPLIKGFEVLAPIPVKVDNKPLKKWDYKAPAYSKVLNISYERAGSLKALPSFSIEMKNKKRIVKTGILFVDLETGGIVNIRKTKTFSFLDIYTSFVDLNYLANEFQPHIYSFVKNVGRKNEDFKLEVASPTDLAEETLNLVKDTYSFSLDSIQSFVERNGVFMTGFRDFREKMDNLFSGRVQQFDLVQVGSHRGVVATMNAGKNSSYEFIPAGRSIGEVYFSSERLYSNKKLESIIQMLYWGELSNKKIKASTNDSTANYLELFTSKESLVSKEISQEVYQNYFFVCKLLLNNNQSRTLKKLEVELQQFLNVLQMNPKKNQKMIQNFSQLLQAIKDENLRYFGINSKKKQTV